MAKPCRICTHPDRDTIELALIRGDLFSKIGARFPGLTKNPLCRHGRRHLPAKLARAFQALEDRHAVSLLDRLAEIESETRRIVEKAERARQYGVAIVGIRELTRLLELAARFQSPQPGTGEPVSVQLRFTPMGPKTVVVQPGVIDVTPEA